MKLRATGQLSDFLCQDIETMKNDPILECVDASKITVAQQEQELSADDLKLGASIKSKNSNNEMPDIIVEEENPLADEQDLDEDADDAQEY